MLINTHIKRSCGSPQDVICVFEGWRWFNSWMISVEIWMNNMTLEQNVWLNDSRERYYYKIVVFSPFNVWLSPHHSLFHIRPTFSLWTKWFHFILNRILNCESAPNAGLTYRSIWSLHKHKLLVEGNLELNLKSPPLHSFTHNTHIQLNISPRINSIALTIQIQ